MANRSSLDRLVGNWTTEATHPMFPGTIVRGTANIEWLEGERFLIFRARTDHPQFPDSVSIIGSMAHGRADADAKDPPNTTDALTMHYYDSRGVFREYAFDADDGAIHYSRRDPGFSQRFTGTWADDGNTLVGQSQLCRDDVNWVDDLAITYRRA